MTAMKKASFPLLVALLPFATHAAGRVFYDDFESGSTGKWSQDGGRNKCVVVSAAVDAKNPFAGTKMAECNWNGVVAWDAATGYSTLRLPCFDCTKEFLIGMKMRYASDVDDKFGSKAFRIYGTDSYYFGAQMEQPDDPIFSY